MATTKYLLVINNIIVRTEDNYPIFEERKPNGEVAYFSKRSQSKAEERFDLILNRVKQIEQEDPMYRVIQDDTPSIKHIDNLKIKLIYTPLYLLKAKFAKDPTKTIVGTTGEDLLEEWNKIRYSYYTDEFLKYSQIMDYLEGIVRISRIKRPNSTPFTVSSNNTKVMNVIHLDIPGLYNPLTTIKGLEGTQLFKSIMGSPDDVPIQLNSPAIFPVSILQGSVMAYFATSTDIMAMCGINHKEPISSRDAYRLVAGIVIRLLFPETTSDASGSALSLPIGRTFYKTIDVNTGSSVRYYKSMREAQEASDRDASLEATEVNTDYLFIRSAFPSYKNVTVNSESELVHELGGADFV